MRIASSWSPNQPKESSCINVRLLIGLLTALCPVICYMSRQNLSIALVSMVIDDSEYATSGTESNPMPDVNRSSYEAATGIRNDSDLSEPSSPIDSNQSQRRGISYGPKYNWTRSEKSIIFETFFWTYVVFQIPAARLAEVVGAKWVLGIAGMGSALISFLSPWVASINVYLLALVRALMGVAQTALYPACYVIYTRWLPPTERSQALPVLGAGSYIGSIITSTATGYFSEQPSLGWEYAFYMPGVVCTIWALLWALLTSSEPREHQFISLDELEYIESKMEVKRADNESKKSPDWHKILTSRQVIAMVISYFASNWAFSITLLLIPSYLSYVLGMSPLKNGLLNSMIYIIFCISSPIVGAVSTLMIRKSTFGLSSRQVRKLFQMTALFGQTFCFMALTFVGGSHDDLVLIILFAQTILYSFTSGGEVQLPSEISVEFTGTIYALGNCVGSSTGFIVPRAYSLIVSQPHERSQWNVYFYLTALITLLGGLVFMIFGSNDREDFAKKEANSFPLDQKLEKSQNC